MLVANTGRLHAQATGGASPATRTVGCWQPPAPDTIEEAAHVLGNEAARATRKRQTRATSEPAMLALSSGELKIAYGAGLLVGWGETGRRPDFGALTAVGKSAVFAPFAFLGDEGDAKIADLILCRSFNDWRSLAREAAGLIDETMLNAIARRHESGARLLVALPGSAARRESVWDLGALAASKQPRAAQSIGEILQAAVDLVSTVEPAHVGTPAPIVVTRNFAFRELGAGEAFLWPHGAERAPASFFLIHNGVLFPDESDDYAASRRLRHTPGVRRPEIWLFPGLDFSLEAGRVGATFRFASVRPALNITAAAMFDPAYLRSLFMFAYRQGRMNKEWQSSLPSLLH